MLGHCEEPVMSGAGPCLVPVYGITYLARVAVCLSEGRLCGPWFESRRGRIQGVQTISSGDRPDSEEVIKQALPTTVGSLVGLNRPVVNALSSTAMKIYGYLIRPGVGFRIK